VTDDACPSCDSGRTRRGGTTIWGIYIAALLLAVPAVLLLQLNAGIVAGALVAVIILAHLVLGTRVCLECGHQWKGR
jgi:hypothetical protein